MSAMLFVVTVVSGQTEKNVFFNCSSGTISYTKPETKQQSTSNTVGKILGVALEAAAGQNTVTTAHPEYADAVRAAIIGAIGRSRRFCVTDAGAETLVDGKPLIIDGAISAISVTRQVKVTVDDKNKKHETIEYKGNLTGNITLKDAVTLEIFRTININSESYQTSWLESEDKALANVMAKMSSRITHQLNAAFPLYASIVEGSTTKKDKQKEVYIDLGENMGIYQGLHFSVYSVREVAGKQAKKEIGRIKVEEVQGDEISLCKVIKGGSDIKKAIDDGATLLVTSYE